MSARCTEPGAGAEASGDAYGSATATGRGKALRILAWPAFANRAYNPYNSLLYSSIRSKGVVVTEFSIRELLLGMPDIWHLHWPDFFINRKSLLGSFARGMLLLALVAYVQRRGTKVMWTIHNLHSHEHLRPRFEARFFDALTRRIDGVFSLSHAALESARERFGHLRRKPAFVTALGTYKDVYPLQVTRAAAREALGIRADRRIVLNFGYIRPYKNVPHLVTQFRGLDDSNAVLVVVGQPQTEELRDTITRIADGDSRVRLSLQFTTDSELHLYLRAADLVVLPFREILNSSSAVLALSCDRPVLVPAMGSMAELAQVLGEDWVRTYAGELTPDELASALKWAVNRGESSQPDLSPLDWSQIAEATIAGYKAVIASTPGGASLLPSQATAQLTL